MEINKNTNSINTTGALNSNAPVKNDESSGAKAKIEKKEKVITLKSLKANILKKQQLCSKNEEKAQQYRKEIAEYCCGQPFLKHLCLNKITNIYPRYC